MIPEDRLEMLKWLSARNAHIPVSELAFMLGLSAVGEYGDIEDPDPDLPVQ
ncbi:MAG TPA: hypothetical protein VNH42_06595 [Mariprofundaceae bacterium]|nr:hypothetical protein [Mariprofundaceae bacterium]